MILDNKKLLFFDPAVIEENKNVMLRVCPPRDRQIVLQCDKPWETVRYITLYCDIIEDNGTYKMFYGHYDDETEKGLLYAESKDGLHWEKPELGIVSYKGSKANNMLGIYTNEACVIFEPDAPQEERYKCFADYFKKGTFLHTSPDGIHWNISEKPLGDFLLDSHNVAFFDKRINKYSFYLRGWPKFERTGHYMRAVVRGETDDLSKPFEYDASLTRIVRPDGLKTISHGEFPTVFAADNMDWPQTDVYTMIPAPYAEAEGYYVAFPSFFRHEQGTPIEDSRYLPHADGRIEVMFAGSMDGIHWHRYDRSAYVSNEISGRYKSNMTFMGTGLIRVGDSLRQYGTIFETSHGEKNKREDYGDGKIVCYEQRIDGFVCAHFSPEGGKIVTCPWVCNGKELIVNVDAGMCGYLKVGLCNEDGKEIEGYGVEDSNVLVENSVEVKVRFKGGDLSAFQGKKVRIIAEGANARLFALQIK